MQRRENSARSMTVCVAVGLIGLTGRVTLGQMRYGSGMLGTGASPAWRALPSESRFNQQASGMLPSEVRGASLAAGASYFSGRAAQLATPSMGSVHFANPYRSTASFGPSRASLAWSTPTASLAPSTRPLGGLSLGAGGTMRYATAYAPVPAYRLPGVTGSVSPLAPGPIPSTWSLAGLSRQPYGGTMRNGSSVSIDTLLADGSAALDRLDREPAGPAVLPSLGLSIGDREGQDVLGIRRPADGIRVSDIPPGYVQLQLGDRTYFRAGWTFYEAHERDGETFYSEIAPPYGAEVDTLPPGCDTLVDGDTTYYEHNDVYYRASVTGSVPRYVVVEPPEEASLPPPIRHLRQVSDYLARVPRFRFEATDTMESASGPTGGSRQSTRRTVEVLRPDRMRVESIGPHVYRLAWYDGKTLSILDRNQNTYVVVDMPDAIDPMLDEVAGRLGIRIPLADLLYSDVYKVLITDAGTNQAQYLGKVKLVNIDCHHLAFDTDTIHWEIWTEVGDRPLPRKLEVTSKGAEDPRRYSVTLRQWDLAPYFPDDHFVFRPPSSAKLLQVSQAADAQ